MLVFSRMLPSPEQTFLFEYVVKSVSLWVATKSGIRCSTHICNLKVMS